MVENDCGGSNPSAICLLRRRLLGVVVELFVERVLML